MNVHQQKVVCWTHIPINLANASPNNKYDPKDRITEFLTDASKVENLHTAIFVSSSGWQA